MSNILSLEGADSVGELTVAEVPLDPMDLDILPRTW